MSHILIDSDGTPIKVTQEHYKLIMEARAARQMATCRRTIYITNRIKLAALASIATASTILATILMVGA